MLLLLVITSCQYQEALCFTASHSTITTTNTTTSTTTNSCHDHHYLLPIISTCTEDPFPSPPSLTHTHSFSFSSALLPKPLPHFRSHSLTCFLSFTLLSLFCSQAKTSSSFSSPWLAFFHLLSFLLSAVKPKPLPHFPLHPPSPNSTLILHLVR